MARTALDAISPFFIAGSMETTLAFYTNKLGFEVTYQQPRTAPFFAIVCRDGAQIFFKAVADNVVPQANSARHAFARWDAYVSVPDPDALASEFAANGVAFSAPLQDTHDGLRGFELTDPNGYVLFFGRPTPSSSG